MEKQSPKVWLLGLIIVAAIYLAILIFAVSVSLLTATASTLPFWILGFSILFLGSTVYVALRKKQTIYLMIGLTVAGIVFIVLGAFLFVPYTTSQTYGTGESFDLTRYILTHDGYSIPFIDQNGTLIENTISPLGSNTYKYISNFGANSSIYQFAYSGSGDVDFDIIGQEYDRSYTTVFLNESFFTQRPGFDWESRWWAPSRQWYSLEFYFILTNLQNQTVSFYFRMTQFWHQESINASSTNYRSVMDPRLGYTGLLTVCVAVAVGAYAKRNLRTSKKNHISIDSLEE